MVNTLFESDFFHALPHARCSPEVEERFYSPSSKEMAEATDL
nr:MAG TPA: hypothetical protein [Caudoviricetes sp.]